MLIYSINFYSPKIISNNADDNMHTRMRRKKEEDDRKKNEDTIFNCPTIKI